MEWKELTGAVQPWQGRKRAGASPTPLAGLHEFALSRRASFIETATPAAERGCRSHWFLCVRVCVVSLSLCSDALPWPFLVFAACSSSVQLSSNVSSRAAQLGPAASTNQPNSCHPVLSASVSALVSRLSSLPATMALQALYKQFLAAPSSSALAQNASLHYITTTTSFHGPTDIIKHLSSQRNQIKKNKEDLLTVVEAQNDLAVQTELSLEFQTTGGAYLPGLDDQFLSDRTVHLAVVSHDDSAPRRAVIVQSNLCLA